MEIDLYSRMNNPIEAIDKIGELFASSGMFGCTKKEQGKVLALICMAEKKSPTFIDRTYHIIDGHLSKKAGAVAADFRKIGGRYKWTSTGDGPMSDSLKAEASFTFEGNTVSVSWSIAQAKQAGAIFKAGSNWVKTPGKMLRARVISDAVGMLAPEVMFGSDSSEPEMDIPTTEEKQVLPTEPARTVTQPEAPKTETAKTPVPETKQPIATILPDGNLTPETVTALLAVFGEAQTVCGEWLLAKGWIKPGETLDKMSQARAGKILAAPAKFVEFCKNQIAKPT